MSLNLYYYSLKKIIMRKILFKALGVSLAALLLVTQTQSLSARTLDLGIQSIQLSELSLDEVALNQAMSELTVLDNFVSQNQNVTYSDLQASGSNLIENISSDSAPLGASSSDDLIGIPAFWWGCVLGWVGLLLVYLLTDNDKAEVKKALKGCVVGTLVGVGLYVLIFVAFASSTTTAAASTGYY